MQNISGKILVYALHEIHLQRQKKRHRYIPGHALHEKGLQRQKGVVPLVGSQEQRALLVLVINRLSNADFVPPSVYIGFRLFVLLERR